MSANHYPQEIEQFDGQAAFWWDPDGPFKTLHQINPVRVKYITDHVNIDKQKLLDVGCGGGILSEALAAKGATVTGLDLSKASLQTAKMHLFESALTVDYQLQSIEDFAAANPESQDVVSCLEMLEHVPSPEGIIDACLAALKPGGWLFLSTLNRTPKAMMLGIFAAEHVLKIVPKGTHHFEQFIKPSELVAMLKDQPVEIKSLTGMRYNPITQSATLDDQDLDINYFMALQKHG
ncbi:bifunctional 2-polyprenyl-6-hydroxyphenol methylase/3-demethylubiquinol 3-O-methyltransferase UbiG [Marinicella litoralis]|uniref:Ubiquinone biosynthesis O-methyltransferase n=1 Tax=Marinicella litoralis TaxID=644220 RepID=A0A4R6XYF0_9GAMM|nr:bifunctional 2-polyprenyl-6-hydroxyphenol methylase/3-demethylubiquinol 3-O-methyltransferase UbiG [Marinicella litoralis]TDR23669.1 3-demethylubiquinone-9 3-methyltransferase [Marinicella litoralis]